MKDFKSKFIVLDGPDGCGKSTQLKLLAERIEKHTQVVSFRDPGTTAIGEMIRNILLDPVHEQMANNTELLLYMAARAQLWCEKIEPALKDGKCVLLDRWLSSTCAYQGYAGGFGLANVIKLADDCLPRPWPDLTIILDIDTESAAARIDRDLDRMELKGAKYHGQVRNGYLELAKLLKFPIVDASETIETVHKNIVDIVTGN